MTAHDALTDGTLLRKLAYEVADRRTILRALRGEIRNRGRVYERVMAGLRAAGVDLSSIPQKNDTAEHPTLTSVPG